MKTIKSLEDITTLEVGDKVVFGNLEYEVFLEDGYHLSLSDYNNDAIFNILNIPKKDFVKNLGIETLPVNWDFPETKSLEALTAIVFALFKEYEKQNELPKTWEEFCEKYPVTHNEVVISDNSDIIKFGDFPYPSTKRDPDVDRNFCISEQEAEAHLALMQLRQLRKVYVKDWEPDLTKACFGIVSSKHGINVSTLCTVYRNLSFPTYDLAEQFLTNFKDLLEIAKPLL